ncbi:putative Rab geranylgeranyl transferase type II beta subunit [Cardiosporidium cionae]|uniref:Geranylgeranyl transferase type-2 subunit beta n=1 Tax=Cardiosporidium cionae TaxID=476202 RepID=A0ABQ7J8F4_9APIC|nr:putative Rab geranylgeranyl transferase type II beta subunit [Cardiosporidium cionae]|eukprot:KAF8820283.1 putative Rab geranylgeranyl transferase type II beta subunit [Cardiosporidium cionae]
MDLSSSSPSTFGVPSPIPSRFLWELHERYILSLDEEKETLMYFLTEQLRIGGIYWGVTALDLMGKLCKENSPRNASSNVTNIQHFVDSTDVPLIAEKVSESAAITPSRENSVKASKCNEEVENYEVMQGAPSLSKNEKIVYSPQSSGHWNIGPSKAELMPRIMMCRHPEGGFGPSVLHDPHIVSTHYVILILAVFDSLHLLDADDVCQWIASLQNTDGSFKGDRWGEVDSRFVYCALSSLTILDRMDLIDVSKATNFILRCRNYDGGFGWVPGGESHAASVFCCVAGLALAEALWHLDKDKLGWWLCERQTPGGGFNGRPEKAPDVCYSWWILSSLAIIDRLDWMDTHALTEFIFASQDRDEGGISDRPEDISDVFHTFFGIAALSLMKAVEGLKPIHPVYALPVETIQHLGLPSILYNYDDVVKDELISCSGN